MRWPTGGLHLDPRVWYQQAVTGSQYLSVLGRSGVLRPRSPLVLAQLGAALARWGVGPAGGLESLVVRAPDEVALIDELGPITRKELDREANSLALALADRGVGSGTPVGVMCRNHRGLLIAFAAILKCGADVVLLNTGFAGPQLVDVLAREDAQTVIHDAEFDPAVTALPADRLIRYRAPGVPGPGAPRPGVADLSELTDAYPSASLSPPSRSSRIILLTSGTTGTPKGANRGTAGLTAALALLAAVPVRSRSRVLIAAPLFHAWGFAHLGLSLVLETTLVTRARFDPEDCLRTLRDQHCQALIAVPVMLQRILALPERVRAKYPVPELSLVAVSGSALPGGLARRWMDAYGDTLVSLYGSTEVGYASVAGPEDLRAAPGTAGRPVPGTTVRILDDDGGHCPAGRTGRIFVGSEVLFDGYTSGENKEVIGGLMATGDLGRLDAQGLLWVAGREDEMVVCGAENVFPQEVEACLETHPAVLEARCLGVPDEEFGTRLHAQVVARGRVREDQLQTWVRDRLARFKVPREVEFVDALPRNATGKLLRSG